MIEEAGWLVGWAWSLPDNGSLRGGVDSEIRTDQTKGKATQETQTEVGIYLHRWRRPRSWNCRNKDLQGKRAVVIMSLGLGKVEGGGQGGSS